MAGGLCVKGKASFCALKSAWEIYQPAGLIGETFEISVPRVDIVAEAYKREVQRFCANATLINRQQP